MAITAALVKELRERTGAGMMECKKALVETDGDIELAIENMRKSGQAKAAKKAGRIAAEGIIVVATSSDNHRAAVVEVNCETDFVARDENFLNFANRLAELVLETKVADPESLLVAGFDQSGSVEDARKALVAKIGENVQVRRLITLGSEDATMGSYLHGGRIGAVVALQGGNEETAKDIAMHIAASNPQFVNPEDVPEALVEKEKEIFTAQAQESGKPPEIIEKMIGGRIKKFLNEISLVGQPFIKDPNKTVGALLKGQSATVQQFVRYEVGEGIEKEEVDFATEVMAQVKGSS